MGVDSGEFVKRAGQEDARRECASVESNNKQQEQEQQQQISKVGHSAVCLEPEIETGLSGSALTAFQPSTPAIYCISSNCELPAANCQVPTDRMKAWHWQALARSVGRCLMSRPAKTIFRSPAGRRSLPSSNSTEHVRRREEA